ncbi:C1 family peptidase [Bradyrhizobium sp. SYSU BS000235]|uniref:C1 family peptidase n=1 Tax=Bradyrhizobium sp. SYSU BS000235 TaxID=3411332 RepID=UPI003C774C59
MAKKSGTSGGRKSGGGKTGGKTGSKKTPAKGGNKSPSHRADDITGETPPVPADARAPGDHALNNIQIGNRRFFAHPTMLATARGKKKLDILPDMPDIRDRPYIPQLRPLRAGIYPSIAFPVRDQGQDSSCTGYSLAHVIDFLRHRTINAQAPQRASARMLYEMAKKNDEWAGSNYEGSSLRGAIKGFFRNGVCTEATAPDKPNGAPWTLTYEMAKEARETRLGAYFRLQPDLTDYHVALNDVGVIYASAEVHSNWDNPKGGIIVPDGKPAGGHAFAIVGYDQTGFYVLNSWGSGWGDTGIAHWSYTDWANSIMDVWVLQLGVRAPTAFGAAPRISLSSATQTSFGHEAARADIIGHFINIDDGLLVTDGKYGSPTPDEMLETVNRLTAPDSNSKKGYDHLVIYAHGGLNTLGNEANRIAAWKRADIWGRNTIYNFHLMWGSGFVDEVFGRFSETPAGRVGGIGNWDFLFEAGLGKEAGTRAWRNMKQDARAAFQDVQDYDGGYKGLKPLLDGLDKAKRRPKLHLVGHSAGAIVLGNLLSAFDRFKLKNIDIESIHLMAPACTVDFFKTNYEPFVKNLEDKIYLYNLIDARELDDTVSADIPLVPQYSHSLLYLVSRAFETTPNMPIAGMETFKSKMPKLAKLLTDYSPNGRTGSVSHGGFDNDVKTISTIMERILGKAPKFPPRSDELTGY